MMPPENSCDREELAARLALWRIKGIGPSVFRKLIQHFTCAANLWQLKAAELQQHALAPALIEALRHPDWYAVAADCRWLEEPHHSLLWAEDMALGAAPCLPAGLASIPQAPPLLFVKGDVACLHRAQIAMVGSRRPSAYGLSVADALARQLAALGIVITSGLALGIDSQCQRGALAVGGQTIGVLAVGLDRIYPLQHTRLAEQVVATGGALVSEFPLGTLPLPQHFPRRNRLISGLSLGVIVVEAALKSGSLITAHYAAEQGRDVFAIPGSIRHGNFRGCHALIKEGAHLLEDLNDVAAVLPELFHLTSAGLDFAVKSPKEPLSTQEQRFFAIFEELPLDSNDIQARSTLCVAEWSVLLTSLLLKGYLVEECGGFRRAF